MYKKIVLVITAAFCLNVFLSVLPSCKRKRSSGTNPCETPACFTYVANRLNLYNSQTHRILDSLECVATQLTLQVYMEGTTMVCSKEDAGSPMADWSLFNKAHAFAAPPACLARQGGDSVVAYNIYADKDYDNQHPAGSSLNDIITTDDVPSRPLYGSRMYLDFLVGKSPAQSGNQYVFTIELTQKDGDKLQIVSPAIKLF
ncbi:MAG: hypothetical protein JNL72_14835 [Flavipsychrobacter sp.]|nr:hypothetical protein [Flavipsychrobacter sp.]